MRKLAIAIGAVAAVLFASGCAYDTYAYYPTDRYAYVEPVHHFYWLNGVRYDCLYNFDSRFCS